MFLSQYDINTGMKRISVVIDNLKKKIITKLSDYGQDGCSVNELFRNLQCGRNEFIDAKNQLIKQGVIRTTKEGRQKIRLSLDLDHFSELDKSFRYILKMYENHADDALKRLKKLRPLFKHAGNYDEPSGVQVTHKNVAIWLRTIIDSIETISHYTSVFTFRYHIDPHAKRFDLQKNQKQGFETIQKIIEKLISQHKDEEKEIRNYLLWGTSSSFSYVIGRDLAEIS